VVGTTPKPKALTSVMASKLFFVVIIIVFPTACYLFSVYIRVHDLT